MVFQDLALFPHMTVRENVAFGLEVRGVPREEIEERVARVLELVKLPLPEYGDRYVHQLSGGQQRVALARALVLEPRLLLPDEPFNHLDFKIKMELIEEFKRLQRRLGVTTIYVTHDQNDAMLLADRIAVMKDGRVQQVGASHEVYKRPSSPFVALFFGDANFIEGLSRGR